MARVKPSLRATETYTEPNFLRVYTATRDDDAASCVATIEHLSYSADSGPGRNGWTCATIVDGEVMSKDDALFIARSYAVANDIPVIYECHNE